MSYRHSDMLPGHYDALGYKAAAYGREHGLVSPPTTADYHMRYDRDTILGVARTMDREVWLIEGLLNRAVDYILGPVGFTLQAKTGDPKINDLIEKGLWPAFAESPEVRGLMDWRAYQALNLRESLVVGDQLHIKLGGEDPDVAGRFQHVESERITGRPATVPEGATVEQGVVLDKYGRMIGFSIADVSPGGYVTPGAGRYVRATDAIFFGQPYKRSSQTRHMPIFTSGLPIAHRLDDVLTSEAISWQVLSRLVATLKRDGGSSGKQPIRSGINAAERTSDAATRNRTAAQLVTDIGTAILFQAGPNDSLDVVSQNRPSLNLAQSVETFARLFCVPLGMPVEVLLLYWRQFNYSSARIVLLQAFLAFRKQQQHQAVNFHSRAYRWQIGRAVASGKLPWRPDILQHEWNVPSWPWIDEDREVSAWARKLDRAIATQTDVLGSLGIDLDEQRANRKKELLDAWKAALEIEEETRGGIRAVELWRHLSGLEQGKTEAAVRAATPTTPIEEGPPNADGN